MNFSAAASRSLVATPARTFASSIFRQRTRISPASAIFSTCSGVFRTIIRYTLDGLVLLQAHRRQSPADLLGHLVGGGGALDPAQHTAPVVIGDQRLGLGLVLLESVADHLGLVGVADDQLAAVEVADPLLPRRGGLDVEDASLLA